jgi:hypothetical protein
MSFPSPSTLRQAPGALLACLAALALTAPRAAAAPPAAPAEQMMIVQYVGNEKGKEMGQNVMLVAVRPPGARSPVVLAVPNQDPKKPDYNPIQRVVDGLNALKPDDYFQAFIRPSMNKTQKPSLIDVRPYTVKPGELEPNVYVFQIHAPQQEGGRTFMGVVLMKLGEQITAAVPTVKTESGNLVPDEKMIASFESFKKDQPVEVTFASTGKIPVIATIDPYAPPEAATFVKVTEADVDGHKAEAVELTVGGKPVTAILTGRSLGKKWVSDPKLASSVKRLKPDQQIEARLVNAGDKTWLRYFKLDTGKKPGAADDKMPAKDKK